jgi:exonuclease SbcD
MRLLHTSDWHVGKRIRGHSRHDEHEAVLAEIVAIAEEHLVDVVLVAGDLFETASPPPEAEDLVYRTLLAFARTGAHVAVIAGNHDNARRLAAVRPLLELGNVHLLTDAVGPDDGGVRTLDIDGTALNLALLPFVSQRGIIRATELMDRAAFEHANVYADRMRSLLDLLSRQFRPDAVNVMMAHAFVQGGSIGGGERLAHLVEEYAVTAQSFPASASYVALGHLHRAQRIAGPAPIHYCGSPLQLDFSEADQRKQVNVITVEPGAPAAVDAVQLSGGRPLRTISGTLDDVRAIAEEDAADSNPAWLRVRLDEARRADLADDVRNLLGDRVVDVQIVRPDEEAVSRPERRTGRDPVELFSDYLGELGVEDERVHALFVELLEDELGTSA